MSISYQAYQPPSAPPLRAAYSGAALSAYALGVSAGQSQSRTSQSAQEGLETYTLDPGATSLKTRLKNLIDQGRPEIAMRLLNRTAEEDPHTFETLADDIYESLLDAGYKDDARELVRISDALRFEPQKSAAQKTYAPSL